jgi:hypothetical protein
MTSETKLTNLMEFDYTPYLDRVTTFMRITGMYDNPEEALKNQYKQLDEEVEELYSACTTYNGIAILDGIGDCVFVHNTILLLKIQLQNNDVAAKALFTLQGLISLLQPTVEVVNYCLDAVITSNLSKFDKNEYEASNTVAHYATLDVKAEAILDSESNLWFVKTTEDCTDINGKTYHKGKILKSVTNYHEPDFSLALEEDTEDDVRI